jgi:hypothetical protein
LDQLNTKIFSAANPIPPQAHTFPYRQTTWFGFGAAAFTQAVPLTVLIPWRIIAEKILKVEIREPINV